MASFAVTVAGVLVTSVLAISVTGALAACGGGDSTPPASTSSSGGSSSSGGASSSSSSSSGGTANDCDLAAVPTGFQANQSVMVGATRRTYSVYIPPSHDGKKGFPVIFAFHGDGGNGGSARSAFKFEDKHPDEAIFVYPDGTNRTWNLDTWDASRNQDVLYMDALADSLKKSLCTKKMYAAGFSRGGFFANHLGCHRGNLFAAVASHGGGGPYDATGMNFDRNGNLLCPTKPVPAQIIIGSNDGLLRDSTTSRNYWQFANGCQAATTPATPSPCVSHNGCAKPLMWCQVPNLGHQVWQSGGDASWDFFKAN